MPPAFPRRRDLAIPRRVLSPDRLAGPFAEVAIPSIAPAW